ncbi:hypothetical protein VTN77DRAFT_8187 [Rasamsonia byssochlamydoides]|uniref:uncharacterized protein n=1 Tax=Rasamsonia byssochlamydoides TaxID=89139 RepID=UPI003744A535
MTAPVAGDKYADDSPLLRSESPDHSGDDSHPGHNGRDLSITRQLVNPRSSRHGLTQRQSDFGDDVSGLKAGIPVSISGEGMSQTTTGANDVQPPQTTDLISEYSHKKEGSTTLLPSVSKSSRSGPSAGLPSRLDDIADSKDIPFITISRSLTTRTPGHHPPQRLSIGPSRRKSDAPRYLGDSDSTSFFKTLGSLSPSGLRRFTLSPRKERYSTIHELDDLKEQDVVTVDISFLEGPANSNLAPSLQSQPRHGSAALPSNNSDDIGTGLVGAEVLVNSAILSRSSRLDLGDEMVRKYGQQLADDKNMIVSVNEASPTVDLSTLEGSQRSNTGSSTTHVSFYYPADPEKPNWKPFSMRSPYITMLIVISLVLAAVQEYLFQRSRSLEAQGDGLIRYNKVSDIPAGEFFCWKYLPTMVMVCFGVLWQVMEYDVKRLEPYYQLSQPTGNTAAKSINLDYVTLWAYFVPIKAIRYRHWTVAVVSVGSVLATTAAPSLQNASVAPVENPRCENGKCPGDFKYIVQIHPVWSRLVTTTLLIVAILAIILLFQLRRKSGLLSDPKGIAGIASMATKSHILTDFQGMDEATHDEIHKKLRHRRYVLYKSSIWQGEYIKHTTEERDRFADGGRKVGNPHPIILRRGPGIAFIVFMTVCLALIPIVTYTGANVVATRVPWLPILMAAVVKQLWTTLEFAVKMLEPFYVLSRGNARPELTLTLDYQGIPYGVLPVRAILNRHYLVALVGVGSILGDILTVTASSLSLNDETVESFIASSTLSMLITAFLVCAGTLIWMRRRHPFLPRQPSTIASILAFIHQSRMLDDFVGTERYSNDEMRAMLIARNKRYGLGWFRGRDKKPHCGIDEEPMLSQYVHGVSYIRAQAPWEDMV